MTDVWSHASGMADGDQLLYRNLHEVFAERDAERRWKAIERTYAEDLTFIDPEGEVVGRTVEHRDALQVVGTPDNSAPWVGPNIRRANDNEMF